MSNYEQRMAELGIDRGAFKTGSRFKDTFEKDHERETFHREIGERQPPPMAPEDLSHLNDPRYRTLQKNAKAWWDGMTKEERAEAARVRFENGRKLAGYKRGKR